MDGPWQLGAKTAQEYGRAAHETAKAMRWVDPSIELAACGSSNREMATYARWEYEVLDHCFDHVDFISLHTYFMNPHDATEEFLGNIELLDFFIKEVIAIADAVAASKAQIVLLGSVDVPTVSAFIKAFAQQHYNPKAFIATAGPDQGTAFVNAVGASNTEGVMVPNAWYPGANNPGSKTMVAAYVAKYGGSASGVNADVAEAFSVGQVATQAVIATHGFNQAKIIAYLHSGVTLSSVQGPVHFDSLGENTSATIFAFQWQKGKFVQVLPVGDPGSAKIEFPKLTWGG